MPGPQNRVLDDLSRLMQNAAGMAEGMRHEVEDFFRARLERILADMDLVSREEFEAVRDMATRAREENERLSRRIAALEAKAGDSSPPRG
jgi:BMFP domain-containing protein YqiC